MGTPGWFFRSALNALHERIQEGLGLTAVGEGMGPHGFVLTAVDLAGVVLRLHYKYAVRGNETVIDLGGLVLAGDHDIAETLVLAKGFAGAAQDLVDLTLAENTLELGANGRDNDVLDHSLGDVCTGNDNAYQCDGFHGSHCLLSVYHSLTEEMSNSRAVYTFAPRCVDVGNTRSGSSTLHQGRER